MGFLWVFFKYPKISKNGNLLFFPVHKKKYQIAIFGYFWVFKEYPQKSQIWKSETSPNQETWLVIPWLGLVSLYQIKYGIFMGILHIP